MQRKSLLAGTHVFPAVDVPTSACYLTATTREPCHCFPSARFPLLPAGTLCWHTAIRLKAAARRWVSSVLLGVTGEPELQTPLFVVFSEIRFIAVLGDAGLITLITTSPQLHAPMYFFLCNLSAVDLCYSTVFSPGLLKVSCWIIKPFPTLPTSPSISFSSCLWPQRRSCWPWWHTAAT